MPLSYEDGQSRVKRAYHLEKKGKKSLAATAVSFLIG